LLSGAGIEPRSKCRAAAETQGALRFRISFVEMWRLAFYGERQTKIKNMLNENGNGAPRRQEEAAA
jgi:hypothetical protein